MNTSTNHSNITLPIHDKQVVLGSRAMQLIA